MKFRTKWLLLLLIPAVLAGIYFLAPRMIPAERFGFAYQVPEAEQELRMQLVDTACAWAGVREDDGSHRPIIDLYNTIDPLPQGYTVTYEDAWCAAFGSAAALEAGLLDIIPAECSCNRQIGLFQQLGRWEEQDSHLPLPGDYIYYDWDFPRSLDCTGWSEHVGIVVGIKWPFLKTIEGNYDDQVKYRILPLWDIRIRGYGRPDFSKQHMQ